MAYAQPDKPVIRPAVQGQLYERYGGSGLGYFLFNYLNGPLYYFKNLIAIAL